MLRHLDFLICMLSAFITSSMDQPTYNLDLTTNSFPSIFLYFLQIILHVHNTQNASIPLLINTNTLSMLVVMHKVQLNTGRSSQATVLLEAPEEVQP